MKFMFPSLANKIKIKIYFVKMSRPFSLTTTNGFSVDFCKLLLRCFSSQKLI